MAKFNFSPIYVTIFVLFIAINAIEIHRKKDENEGKDWIREVMGDVFIIQYRDGVSNKLINKPIVKVVKLLIS